MARARRKQKRIGEKTGSIAEVFRAFLTLGLTSFGGPVAHIGYFRNAFVQQRKWLDEHSFADLLAMCQFLPGPASSQLGMAIGLVRAGLGGLLAAWVAFTAPSALLLLAFAYGVTWIGGTLGSGWLAGLKAAAVAVVMQAVISMARSLCTTRELATIAIVAAAIVSLRPDSIGQISTLLLGALAGAAFLRETAAMPKAAARLHIPVSHGLAAASLAMFGALLLFLPLVSAAVQAGWLQLADSFYRAGSLVFGGGHVVLPLLEAETRTLIPHDRFLAGYGAAQAVPGPLFSFAAYLGALMPSPPNGVAGAMAALAAIFLPSMLLVIGVLPFWWRLREGSRARAALSGINAAVVGLLGAALWHPILPLGITNIASFVIALFVYAAIEFWKVPPWAAVIAAAIAGFIVL